MLLSFSVDYMRPYVEAGIRQWRGEDVGTERVKRQTIRKRGVVGDRLIERGTKDLIFHLWWKSRTKERAFIGAAKACRLDAVEIKNVDGQCRMAVRGAQCSAFRLADIVHDDGFDSVYQFRDYFVPADGDVFLGVLYRW